MRHFPAIICSVVALCAVGTASSAGAQQEVSDRVKPGYEPLRRVEPGVADLGPLTDSLRAMDMRVELREPTGFGQVYMVPGRPGMFMRVNAGLYAVFPHSVYGYDKKGREVPEIPPGTEYYIGGFNTVDTGDSHIPLAEANPTLPVGTGNIARPRRGIDTRQFTRVSAIDDLRPTDQPGIPRPGDYTPQFADQEPDITSEIDAASTPEDLPVPLESTGANPQPPRYITMATSADYRANRTRQLLARALSNELTVRSDAVATPASDPLPADAPAAEPAAE